MNDHPLICQNKNHFLFNLNTANWEYIRQRKQDLINKINKRENAGRIIHEYKFGGKVLLKRGNENKYESPYQGPFEILKVNDNGTVRLTAKFCDGYI